MKPCTQFVGLEKLIKCFKIRAHCANNNTGGFGNHSHQHCPLERFVSKIVDIRSRLTSNGTYMLVYYRLLFCCTVEVCQLSRDGIIFLNRQTKMIVVRINQRAVKHGKIEEKQSKFLCRMVGKFVYFYMFITIDKKRQIT